MTLLGLIVVAAGSSTRMGGIDKVWAPLGGKPVLAHSLTSLSAGADRTVLVVHQEQLERAREELLPTFPGLLIVEGGAERQQSVARGLGPLRDVDMIAVHDAARPFASASLLQAGIQVLERADGAIPTEAVRDTIKEVRGERVVRTIDRSVLRTAQTPQIFRASALRAAHGAGEGHQVLTDDAALVEESGYDVRCFAGSPANFKITTSFDLQLATMILQCGGSL